MSGPEKDAEQLRPFHYQCPQEGCGSSNLSVEVSNWQRLKQFPGGSIVMEPENYEPDYWDGSSQMRCNECGWYSPADFFKVFE